MGSDGRVGAGLHGSGGQSSAVSSPVPPNAAQLVPEVTEIAAAHMTDLRTALREAYEAVGRVAPVFVDPEIAPRVGAIRAVHLRELRAAVVVLEQAVWP